MRSSRCSPALLASVILVACGSRAVSSNAPTPSTTALYQPSREELFVRLAGDNNLEDVKAMLDQGMDPNVLDPHGDTALQAAVRAGRVETVRILIAAGADVHVRDQNDAPLLHLAVSDEGVPIMEMLLEAGLYVDSVNRYGTTPLMWAAHGGNTRATVFLLSKGANVNWQNLSGITPLLDAARQGRARDAEVLLAHGANKDWAIPGDGMTALMLAAYRGDVDTVNVLLRAGVDVNAKRFDGSTALTKALEECHTEIADLLRAAGAKE